MLRTHYLLENPHLFRCICSSSAWCNELRESRFLRKMLTGSRKKKLFFNTNDAILKSPPIEKKLIPTHKTRRADVLNKLFMKYITDLMATGEVASELLGREIDISRVSVTTDFKLLNVYWYSKDDQEIDESTETILCRCGGQLQHELSQLRVIGVVPPIRFVKDKHLSKVNEVEKRLAAIGFEKDMSSSNIKKDEPILFTQLSSDTKAEILNLVAANQNSVQDSFDVDLPQMRQDIFSLNHSQIMKKVKKSLSKKLNSAKESSQPCLSELPEKSFSVENHLSASEKRELFTKFLKMRQIEQKRLKKSHENFEILEESEYPLDDENDYLREEEKDDFEIDETNIQEWK